MEERLTFQYDREADILYIGKRFPYLEQESEELGEGVVARMTPSTGEIENLEILFFQHGWSEAMLLSFRSRLT